MRLFVRSKHTNISWKSEEVPFLQINRMCKGATDWKPFTCLLFTVILEWFTDMRTGLYDSIEFILSLHLLLQLHLWAFLAIFLSFTPVAASQWEQYDCLYIFATLQMYWDNLFLWYKTILILKKLQANHQPLCPKSSLQTLIHSSVSLSLLIQNSATCPCWSSSHHTCAVGAWTSNRFKKKKKKSISKIIFNCPSKKN